MADDTNVAPVPTSGGTPSVVAMGSPVGPLAVGPTAVYVGFQNYPGISMIPLAGGPASGLTITNQNGGASVLDLTGDGSSIYWIDAQQIATVPVTGGDADRARSRLDPTSRISRSTAAAICIGANPGRSIFAQRRNNRR